MPRKTTKSEDFEMKSDYWELVIDKADYNEVKFEVTFKDKKIPLGEMRKLEEAIRKVLEACGRLESLQPSKRQ